jgi:putative NADH-flavin reductase
VKLVVFGAGGAIGRRVVGEALERGHDVTAVYRTAAHAGRNGARAVRGDVRDPFPVLRLAAPDAVISAVGAAPASAAPDLAVYLDGARALVEAARALGDGAPRLLAVGGAGSLEAGPGMRVIATPQFPAEFREEALAQARALDFYRTVSDVRWTYVSPAALIEPGARTGRYRTGGDALLTDEHGHSRITMEDYAVALLDELEHPRAIDRRMTVAY